MRHQWIEVIPPRAYGNDSRPKMAVRCQLCGSQKILLEEDAKYILTTECPGKLDEEPTECQTSRR